MLTKVFGQTSGGSTDTKCGKLVNDMIGVSNKTSAQARGDLLRVANSVHGERNRESRGLRTYHCSTGISSYEYCTQAEKY